MKTKLQIVVTIILILLTISFLPVSAQSDDIVFEIQVDFKPTSVNWSPDGELLSITYPDGTMIFDNSLQFVALLSGDSIVGQSWNSDGSIFVTGGGFTDNEGIIQIWNRDLETNEFTLVHKFTNSYKQIIVAELSPNDQYLATLSWSLMGEAEIEIYTVEIWNTDDWSLKTTLRNQYWMGRATLSWSPDSTRIAGMGRNYLTDGMFDMGYDESGVEGIYIADIETGDRLVMIDDGTIPPNIIWISDDEILANFPELNVYDSNTGDLQRTLSPATGSISYNPKYHLIADKSGYINLVNADDGTFVYGFPIENNVNMRALEWSPEGDLIATIIESGIIQIWDASPYVRVDTSSE